MQTAYSAVGFGRAVDRNANLQAPTAWASGTGETGENAAKAESGENHRNSAAGKASQFMGLGYRRQARPESARVLDWPVREATLAEISFWCPKSRLAMVIYSKLDIAAAYS
jgi:hypothetical protein